MRTRTGQVCGAALLAFFCAAQVSPALAQGAPSAPHGKAAAIPEKKPDGTWDGLKPAQQKILKKIHRLPQKKFRLSFQHHTHQKHRVKFQLSKFVDQKISKTENHI